MVHTLYLETLHTHPTELTLRRLLCGVQTYVRWAGPGKSRPDIHLVKYSPPQEFVFGQIQIELDGTQTQCKWWASDRRFKELQALVAGLISAFNATA